MSSLSAAMIDAESFLDGDEKKVFAMIQNHYSAHGKYPNIKTVMVETGVTFPLFPAEAIGYWIGRVERRRQLRIIGRVAQEITEATGREDVTEAKEIVRQAFMELQDRSSSGRVISVVREAGEVLKKHDKIRMSPDMTGIPFGLPYLDAVSDGAQPTDTIAVVGRPSTGKSMVLLLMANNAYNAGFVPLVCTLEMSPMQCVRRILAMRAGISATALRTGRLGHWGRKKAEENIAGMLGESRPFHMVYGSMRGTVEDLALRVQELRPSMVYVDGAYLLRTTKKTEARWERIAETAEFLKMLAAQFNIPILATYQFNRRGPGSLANIGGADTVGQLASIVLGVEDDTESDEILFGPVQHKLLEILKGREGERGTLRLCFDMSCTKISQEAVVKGCRVQE